MPVFSFSMGQMVQLIQWERKRTAAMILCLILGVFAGVNLILKK